MLEKPASDLIANNIPAWDEIAALEINKPPYLIGVDDQNATILAIDTSAGMLHLQIGESGVRLRTAQQREQDYGLLVKEPKTDALELEQFEQSSIVNNGYLQVCILHYPLSFEIKLISRQSIIQSSTDGHFVRRYRVPPLAKISQGWLFSFALKSNESVYGLGEKWGSLNKRGQLIRSYNHDALGVNAEISYKNVPFCWSPQGWGIFHHTPAPVTHAVGYAPWSHRSYCSLLEDECFDLFIFVAKPNHQGGNVGASLLRSYTNLTGRAPIPPSWSTGVILSKAYYQDADEILDAARQVRERNMPCDVITFDGRAWQDTETRFAFEWSPSRYPDPKKVIDELKALHFKICVWEYPLISTKHSWFQEFADKGWLLIDRRTGEAYQYHWNQRAFGDVLTPLPISGIVDFTHPDAYAFWRDAHKDLFELGVDMIKADFGEQVEDDNILAHNGEFGHALHNIYAHLYNRCVYEAAQRYSKLGPFIFSRAGWTGSQRFNSQWGGDPQADWEGMMSSIRGGLSWGLSGAPFYATDVGGFYKDSRDDVLYVRWVQAGIFSAHFRLHGIGAREPWSYSEAAERAVNNALQLRYRLRAYIEKAMEQSHLTGLPVQRAMVLAFPVEKQAWSFENQFMFGDDLLVVPCYEASGKVEFYLPEGHWYPFDPGIDHSHDLLIGQQVYQRTLELDEMAVFARSGTKIPLCKVAQYMDQFTSKTAFEMNWIATSTN